MDEVTAKIVLVNIAWFFCYLVSVMQSYSFGWQDGWDDAKKKLGGE